ncbi:MAG: lamin tail domain-containing protein [Candidatus Latescibacteria bacterium]|nr:lamin tail domain-containing protein [Candidatus Latescibacterota bacterium]
MRTSKIVLTTLMLVCLAGVAAAQTPVFFSEYLEGSSNNKAVEIYNGTSGDLDMSRVTVDRYNNGAIINPAHYTFTGTLVSGDVFVIGNPSTSGVDPVIIAQSDLFSDLTFYNGDDVLILFLDGIVVDSIGQLGNDPGTFWGTAPITTAEYTLVRDASVCVGDVNVNDFYDPALDGWLSYPQNTMTYLGSHTSNCIVANEASSWGAVKALY